MRRQLHCLLLSAALTVGTGVSAAAAASSKDYAGPCANEAAAPGTPQFLVVDAFAGGFHRRQQRAVVVPRRRPSLLGMNINSYHAG